jgi:hypothetical protein
MSDSAMFGVFSSWVRRRHDGCLPGHESLGIRAERARRRVIRRTRRASLWGARAAGGKGWRALLANAVDGVVPPDAVDPPVA